MANIEIKMPNGFGNVLASQIEAAASEAVSKTLIATRAKWTRTAQQRLKSTRMDYIMGLNADNSLEFPDPYTGVLTLRGGFPNMLEEGYSSFDMKQGFARSSKKHVNKDGGWYMNIPFRHRTPAASGVAGGAPMPDDIYANAKKLRGVRKLTGTEENYPASKSWTGYQHKSGMYENMGRVSKDYAKSRQHKFQTFRRVSINSDPNSWKHPGFAGIQAIDVVQPFAQRTLNRVLKNEIQNAMEG